MFKRIVLMLVLAGWLPSANVHAAHDFQIGRAKSDITLPVWGIQMLGYVHPKQIGTGIRQRQYARTFVIADAQDQSRLAYVTCELAFVTHTLKLAVLERVREKLGDRYDHANLILAGTHTHGTPGGYHHHLSASALGGDFFLQAFDALAEGIAESILAADADLQPGSIYMAQGEVQEGNANRSHIAYRNNPEEERGKYKSPVDTHMTLLKFVRDDGAVGLLNWFAVHPTSVNFHYKLTTSDNKGYAASVVEEMLASEAEKSGPFIAAFANSNCGDATPNLNLDATGPGSTDLESCAIQGGRQAETAQQLFASAAEKLQGAIEVRHAFVNLSNVTVADQFTGAGEQHTAPSAWGYAFAAGSDAEGGGHPLFHEGMTKTDPGIEALIRLVMPSVKPTPEFIESQKPKAVLIASGLARPPLHEQVLPLAVARIGQLVLVIGPAEYTTMSGRRFREAVGQELGVDPSHVVIAGYANDFAGYVTTWHEYQLQQYEGGHTLFGPWSEAAYRQEFVRLAQALKSNATVESRDTPTDMRTIPLRPTSLDGPDEQPPAGARFGDVATAPRDSYKPGETITATFWTGLPVNGYDRHDEFLAVERLVQEPDTWEAAPQIGDWETAAEWKRITPEDKSKKARKSDRTGILDLAPPRYATTPDPFQVSITWESKPDTPPGTYRLVHYGRYREGGQVHRFTAYTAPFKIEP
ncbi:MAG: neutral/alkaline non-lysosomal ceramidase N-terminal domain-containing protein [Pirellulales bacterium]|nr:neutral/alkaline non-lysosomal ceramidase N-terminal domain-containing protein [Pirellulales bacterium]